MSSAIQFSGNYSLSLLLQISCYFSFSFTLQFLRFRALKSVRKRLGLPNCLTDFNFPYFSRSTCRVNRSIDDLGVSKLVFYFSGKGSLICFYSFIFPPVHRSSALIRTEDGELFCQSESFIRRRSTRVSLCTHLEHFPTVYSRLPPKSGKRKSYYDRTLRGANRGNSSKDATETHFIFSVMLAWRNRRSYVCPF